ncbi:hypothetical protein AYI68_g3018 [Smittium mucronatum]|uniref:Uncharacterized protein n=1 Tax=Smittium mucronatum TaxID=133383 RepID=A0A1R0H135_9FUNG|nr:hypothetical protein AYI68_g3018 [Smittium mucronatum]
MKFSLFTLASSLVSGSAILFQRSLGNGINFPEYTESSRFNRGNNLLNYQIGASYPNSIQSGNNGPSRIGFYYPYPIYNGFGYPNSIHKGLNYLYPIGNGLSHPQQWDNFQNQNLRKNARQRQNLISNYEKIIHPNEEKTDESRGVSSEDDMVGWKTDVHNLNGNV